MTLSERDIERQIEATREINLRRTRDQQRLPPLLVVAFLQRIQDVVARTRGPSWLESQVTSRMLDEQVMSLSGQVR